MPSTILAFLPISGSIYLEQSFAQVSQRTFRHSDATSKLDPYHDASDITSRPDVNPLRYHYAPFLDYPRFLVSIASSQRLHRYRRHRGRIVDVAVSMSDLYRSDTRPRLTG